MPVWTWTTHVDGTRVVLRYAEVDGRAECVGLEVGADFEASDARDPPPLTSSALRRIKLAELIEEGARRYRDQLRELAELPGFLNSEPDPEGERLARRTRTSARRRLPAATATTRRGRTGRPIERGPEHLAQVAKVYAHAYRAGQRPTEAVRQEWQVSKTTAAKWVARAREAGLLGPTTQRRAGGVPIEDRPRREPPHG
jgi:hypothetical protein